MNILPQYWFPSGDIGVGVFLKPHWLNIGFPFGNLAILALAISCRGCQNTITHHTNKSTVRDLKHCVMVRSDFYQFALADVCRRW